VYYIHYDMSHNKHERENCHFYVAHPIPAPDLQPSASSVTISFQHALGNLRCG
jgi:hypothetical protein